MPEDQLEEEKDVNVDEVGGGPVIPPGGGKKDAKN